MAALTGPELLELRSLLCRNSETQHWTKAQVGDALQAIEDRIRLQSTLTTIGNDIETAAPGVFTAQEKLTLFGIWCASAARRLGII